jgi:TolB-like protein/class 3 adenylate cyclase
MSETRKITAVLVADVVGYSRLVGADEDRTLARLRALRSDLIDPTIAVHKGRVVKRTGDGALVEFHSVVDAVRCAVEVQSGMVERNAGVPPERRIEFRIGIHLGDVVEESDGDLMGDGVNIAARLEGIAKPGTICLSEDAYRQVKARLDFAVTDLGHTELKNIADPVRVYSLQVGAPAQAEPAALVEPAVPEKPSPQLALPDKPSIAVLPFQNLSADTEQEYFADGMVEEIITALSRMRWLFVIARNSSFTYKGKAVDVKQIGRELGVRYVLEGSVRKAGNRVRITGQLVDAGTGAHLWADRFEGSLEDVFDLQDQVTTSVVAAIAPRLEQAEIERSRRKPTKSLDAYDYYLRGLAAVHQWTEPASVEALSHFHRAIELDAGFAAAYGMAARCYSMRKVSGWLGDPLKEIAEAERLARRAAMLGRNDAVALATAAITLSFVVGDVDRGRELAEQATAIDPNMAWAWLFSGWTKVWLGDPEAAQADIVRALRLSPLDPHRSTMFAGISSSCFFVGRYDEALAWAERAMRHGPGLLFGTALVAASAALAGNLTRARQAIERVRSDYPDVTISSLSAPRGLFPLRRPDDIARFAEGLRKAGLPE